MSECCVTDRIYIAVKWSGAEHGDKPLYATNEKRQNTISAN